MKNYITDYDWERLEHILKLAEVPYSVTWDSHVSGDNEMVIFDKRIIVEPMIIQSKERLEDCNK